MEDNVGAEQGQSGWRDIATAPRDGTVVDLWVNCERLANCFWDQPDPDPEEEYDGGWRQQYAESTVNSFQIWGSPNYWMPLPEPPK